MRRHGVWKTGLLATAAWLQALPAVVSAQTAAPATAAVASANVPADAAGLDDIVVTAQRRTQTAREVPLALSVLGADTLVSLKIQNVTSLLAAVPGTSGAFQGVNQRFVVIRGISTNSIGIGGEASIGIFVDEAYIGRLYAQGIPFFDVERIEVLKGPQGSLYGRNSTGGAISIITRKPALNTHELDVSASYGSFNAFEATAAGTVPLGEHVALRLAVLGRTEDGFDRNVATGRRDQSFDTIGGRASLAAELTDNLRANLSVSYARERAGGLPFKTTVPELAAISGVDTDPFSGRFAQSFDGNERSRSIGSNLTLTWDIADTMSVKTVSSFNNVEYSGTYDLDGSVVPFQKYGLSGRGETFGQELRVTFDWDRVKLQFGGNVFLERVSDQKSLTYDENFLLPAVAGSVFGSVDGSIPADLLFPGSPSFVPCDAISVELLGVSCSATQFEAIRQNGRYRSLAAFAEAEVKLTPTLTLTAGGRYSADRKRFAFNAPPIVSQGSILLGVNPILGGSTDGTVAQTKTWRDFQPRGVLRWQPDDDLNIYGSITRGFKSGGFDPSTRNGAYDPDQTVFEPESVWSYELGVKARLFDRRAELSLAAYRFRYRDFQVQVLREGIPLTLNVPDYDAFGVEAEITARLARDVTVTAGGSWNSAEFGDFITGDRFNPGGTLNLKGNRGVLSPEFSGFARADWTVPLAAKDVQIRLSADVNWRSRQFFTIYNDPREAQAPYALVGGRLALENSDQRWSVALLVQNLFNKDYLVSAVEQGFGISTFRGQPRAVQIEVRGRF